MHLKHVFPFLLQKFHFRNSLWSLGNNYYDMHLNNIYFHFNYKHLFSL